MSTIECRIGVALSVVQGLFAEASVASDKVCLLNSRL